MKHITFLSIGIFLLVIALCCDPLYSIFPSIFEPVEKFISQEGAEILYIAGFLALIIGLFTWLPTWVSLWLFVALIFTSGYFLSGKEISILINKHPII